MINIEQKIFSFENAFQSMSNQILEERIVLCFGHFNTIHPGHIRYLEHARTFGSHLVVALMGDHMIDQSILKKHFTAHERAIGVANLQLVDRVIILDSGNLAQLIDFINPKYFVLGKEFEKKRRKDIEKALEKLHQKSGEVVFHAGEVYYSTWELLKDDTINISKERIKSFLNACQLQRLNLSCLLKAIQNFDNSRLMVIGDTIVDQYVACDAIGMSAEAPVMVVRELKTKEFVGGAAIVAAHANALGAQCHYLSVVGKDINSDIVRNELDRIQVPYTLISDISRPTTLKIRYMVENQKLFRVSRMKEHSLSDEIEEQIIKEIERKAQDLDGIIISDFVYGVITDRILQALEEISQQHGLKLFGDLQCSSQIGNVGKYRNCYLLCPTEREARIALANKEDGMEWIAQTIMKKTFSKNLLLKLGSEGFIVYSTEKSNFVNRQHFPALCANPTDVTGAGDSLLALMAVSLCSGNNIMSSAAIGTCVSSLAVQKMGNIPIQKESLEQYIRNLKINA